MGWATQLWLKDFRRFILKHIQPQTTIIVNNWIQLKNINFVDPVGSQPGVNVDVLGEVGRATPGHHPLEAAPEFL